MSNLDEFFENIRPFMLGERSAKQLGDALGESPSGEANLEFYPRLIRRNLNKFLKDMYPSVFKTVENLRKGWWRELVAAYSEGRHPSKRDPNEFSRAFPEFLAETRAADSELPEIVEQLADLQWLRHEVNIAADDTEGLDQTIFVRQYSFPVPQFYKAVLADPTAPIPEPADTLALVFRSVKTLDPAFIVISPLELAALARREGQELPGPLASLPAELLDGAEQKLVRRGVLRAEGVAALET